MSAATPTMSVHDAIMDMGRRARTAARAVAQLSAEQKNAALVAMAHALVAATPEVLAANAQDVADAVAHGTSSAMVERLRLDAARVKAVAAAIEEVAALPDPVGTVLESWQRPNGLRFEKVSVPIGTIGMIFESRPNVTADAASLCFKSGNAVILRGGSEALRSNTAIANALRSAAGVPQDAVQLVPFADRDGVTELARMDKWLDLCIPRGGRGLIEAVASCARVPVIKHYDGICHVFVDKAADAEMAINVTVDSKAQKCGVCNATETLLVHREAAAELLPKIAAGLRAKKVEIRGCDETRALLQSAGIPCVAATEQDWHTEYLDLIISVKIVASLEEAIAFINEYGSHHTDAIVTADQAVAERFLREVDSACVFHNVSTRFSDGGEFGFGAEIGISTDRVHARGPMGLKELTIYQYRVRGAGHTKAPVCL